MTIVPCDGRLNLSNDGTLEIFFIGVGSAFATTRFQTNFLIIKGDRHVLVDFGITGPAALRQVAGLELTDISTFLPTHSHCDHVGGVEMLALMNRYVGIPSLGRPKLSAIINEEYQQVLWEMSLRGGMEWNEISSEGQRLSFNDFFTVVRPERIEGRQRETWQLSLGDLDVEFFRTNHIPDNATHAHNAFISYGLFIDNRIFISGDTKFDRELIDLYADRSEFMFHDATTFANPVHAYVEDLRGLPADIKSKMVLMHYPDGADQVPADDFLGWALQGMRYIFD
jgi:ribonuclease BN (tRNA processing enzyme)